MLRIILAEIKKTFAKPGIFILTGILILVLFACSFLYQPTLKDNSIVSVEKQISQNADVSISAMYNHFANPNASVSLDNITKNFYDQTVENYSEFIDFYYNLYYPESEYALANPYDTSKHQLKDSLDESLNIIKSAYETYYYDVTNSPGNNNTNRSKLEKAIQNFYSDVSNLEQNNNEHITILMSKGDYTRLLNSIKQAYLFVSEKNSNAYDHNKIIENLEKSNFINVCTNQLTKLEEFKPSQEVLDELVEYVKQTKERLGSLLDIADSENLSLYGQISTFALNNATSKEDSDKDTFNKLVTKVKLLTVELGEIIRFSIYIDGLSAYTPSQINSLSTFENFNYYQVKESLVKSKYLFDTNTYDFQYASSLSLNQTSNEYINAYDFATFALRLCAFIIIIYCVVLAAGSIAGEQQAGTLKLLAIRPYTRTTLFLGKMFATILVGFILISLSAIATFIAGAISYGAASAPVLLIFNASTAITMPVILEFLIMILTMFFEISFFVVISYGISTIFKSNVGAVAISIMIYFMSLVLNTLAASYSILRFLPFTNMNLFKYFGGSFLSTNGGFLQAILTPSVVVGSDFFFSLLLSGIFAVAVLIATLVVFKKRDLK